MRNLTSDNINKWETTSFSKIAEIVMGQSPPGASYNSDGIGIPLLNGPTEFTDRHPIARQWTSNPTKICEDGDILLCVRGSSTGRMNISDGEYCIGRGIAAIRKKTQKGSTEYLHYLLEIILHEILRRTAGSTFPNIDKKSLSSIHVSMPPIIEQVKIAHILSTWDEAIAVTEKLIAALKQRKKGLMQRLLTGEIRFPGFKDEWNEISVENMGEIFSGGTPSTSNPEYWDGEIFWATPTNITSLENRYITETDRKITKRGLLNSSATLIEPFSLLICTRATIGELAINTMPITTNQGFKSLVPNKDFEVNFLYYLFQQNKNKLIRYSNGSTFLELSKKDFLKMRFFVPGKKEQSVIAEALNFHDDAIELSEKYQEQIKFQKKGLMQRLLTGQVRVKVKE